jgi:hypothetical protein
MLVRELSVELKNISGNSSPSDENVICAHCTWNYKANKKKSYRT